MAPPQINSNVSLGHVYRFLSSSASATTVTVGSLLAACGSTCKAVNTTVTAFTSSVKVNRVSIWSPPASQGASATCSINWIGGLNSSDKEISDTTVSVAQPAHISSSPPPRSLAEFWNNGSNAAANLFTLIAPIGSIIDVSVSQILFDEDSGDTSVDTAVAAAVFNKVYYLSLDPNATHHYTPISLTTTI